MHRQHNDSDRAAIPVGCCRVYAQVQLHWSRKIPFLFPTADARNIDILQHMTVVLGTYVIVDTSHLLRVRTQLDILLNA